MKKIYIIFGHAIMIATNKRILLNGIKFWYLSFGFQHRKYRDGDS